MTGPDDHLLTSEDSASPAHVSLRNGINVTMSGELIIISLLILYDLHHVEASFKKYIKYGTSISLLHILKRQKTTLDKQICMKVKLQICII